MTLTNYLGISELQAKAKIERIFYREKYYNLSLEVEGYQCIDRELDTILGHRLEMADLFKDTTMYIVKFGETSSKLSYAIDQALEAAKAYKRKDIVLPKIMDTVCLWFVLKHKELPIINGFPDINSLKLIILKNRLDQWKKEIRMLGYKPIIKINYVCQ